MKPLIAALCVLLLSCASGRGASGGDRQLLQLEADNAQLNAQVNGARADARTAFDRSSGAVDRTGVGGLRCGAVFSTVPPPNGATTIRLTLARGLYQARPSLQPARQQGTVRVQPGSCSVVRP